MKNSECLKEKLKDRGNNYCKGNKCINKMSQQFTKEKTFQRIQRTVL